MMKTGGNSRWYKLWSKINLTGTKKLIKLEHNLKLDLYNINNDIKYHLKFSTPVI